MEVAFLEDDCHERSHPRPESVRQPRPRIGLVDDHRDAGTACREIGGCRCVASEADDDIDISLHDEIGDSGDRGAKSWKEAECSPSRTPGNGSRAMVTSS